MPFFSIYMIGLTITWLIEIASSYQRSQKCKNIESLENEYNKKMESDFKESFGWAKVKRAAQYQFALESFDFIKGIYAMIFDLAFMGLLAPTYIWKFWQNTFYSIGFCD